ncbi:M23 family metallopeptidase [Desulfarculus baarsii]
MAMKLRPWLLAPIIIIVLLAGLAVFLWPHYEGNVPRITLEKAPKGLGLKNEIDFQVTDQGKGLRWVRVYLRQGQKTAMLLEHKPEGPTASVALKATAAPLAMGFSQGPAELVIEASDNSLRNWGSGNLSQIVLPLAIDTTPPRIMQRSGITYVNRGGSAVAVYEIDDGTTEHGVMVGQRRFKGHNPWPDQPRAAMCLFAFPFDEPRESRVSLWAADHAGNKANAPLRWRLRWRNFRADKLNASDNFLAEIQARFGMQAPPTAAATPLAVFQWVNVELREQNHQRIAQAASQTGPYQLWSGTFLRAPGKTMAGFGEHRTYFHNGQEISQGYHLGIDLADVERSPVPAAAGGVVRLAENLGIYGNCVIVDHGQGLSTLYGHLSQLGVTVGQTVEMGQELGLSGATGLALGDHLHFSVMVDGIFVVPTEWWDPHWIQDNVLYHYEESGLPTPLATPAGGKAAGQPQAAPTVK